jgi:hypothetical protein
MTETMLMVLMVRIGRTSTLTRNTVDGVHVMVTHVCTLGSNVFRAHCRWKVLGSRCSSNPVLIEAVVAVAAMITIIGEGRVILEIMEYKDEREREREML